MPRTAATRASRQTVGEDRMGNANAASRNSEAENSEEEGANPGDTTVGGSDDTRTGILVGQIFFAHGKWTLLFQTEE